MFDEKEVFCQIVSKCLCGAWQATEKDEAASMKDWILRYAEQSSEEEEEEGGKKTCNPELEEKFDPVSTIRATEFWDSLHLQL